MIERASDKPPMKEKGKQKHTVKQTSSGRRLVVFMTAQTVTEASIHTLLTILMNAYANGMEWNEMETEREPDEF